MHKGAGRHWLLVPIATCLIALFPLSSAGYLFVKITVSFSALYIAIVLASKNSLELRVVFAFLAFLYNPIIPVYLHEKMAWNIIDIIVALLFFQAYRSVEGDERGVNKLDVLPAENLRLSEAQIKAIVSINDVSWRENVLRPLSLVHRGLVVQNIASEEAQVLNFWAIGYFSGFIFYNFNSELAFGLAERGLWVRQAAWGRISEGLNRFFVDVLPRSEATVMRELLDEQVFSNPDWIDGYEFGIRDAEMWRERRSISLRLKERLWGQS